MPVSEDFSGKRITVMGLGRFGGGAGVTRFLASHGARVLLTDAADPATLAEPLESIRDLIDSGAVDLRFGAHHERDFTQTDLVVANPAVPRPWQNQYLLAAHNARVPITTEIRLLIERLPNRARTIAVTGTAGKSTTAALIARALNATAETPVHLGGNIGGSLLQSLDTIRPEDWIVLELSSAQLHWLSPAAGMKPGWSPRIAALTGFAPNHLDWHGDETHYRDSKAQLFRNQDERDIAIFTSESDEKRFPEGAARRVCIDPARSQRPMRLNIVGAHNRANAALALRAVAEAVGGVGESALPRAAEALEQFPGLPHRLQLIATWRPSPNAAPIRAFNDSKSTTPEAAILAVEALEDDARETGSPTRIHLIAGGYDKQIDLTPVAALIPRLAGLYTIGATAPAITRAAPADHSARVHTSETLDRAVAAALEAARPGDTILLSPACASWDQFTNYEERGATFTRLIQNAIPTPHHTTTPPPHP